MFNKIIATSGNIIGFTTNFAAQIPQTSSAAVLTIPYSQFDSTGQITLSVFMDGCITIYDPGTGRRQGNYSIRVLYTGGFTNTWSDFTGAITDIGSAVVDTGLNNSGVGVYADANGLRANGSAVVLTINPRQGVTNPYILNFTGVLTVSGSFATAANLNSVTVLGM